MRGSAEGLSIKQSAPLFNKRGPRTPRATLHILAGWPHSLPVYKEGRKKSKKKGWWGEERDKSGTQRRPWWGGFGGGWRGVTAEVLASVPWRAAALHLLSARAWNCRLMGFSAPWPPPFPASIWRAAAWRASRSATRP